VLEELEEIKPRAFGGEVEATSKGASEKFKRRHKIGRMSMLALGK